MTRLTAAHNLPFIVPTATHRTINAATGELIDSGIWGAISAVFFLLLFLRKIRLTILVCLAIPGSLALAVIGLAAYSNPVNIFTMVGFLLALGMLVDNSVVVGEALHRAPQSHDPQARKQLRQRAAKQVSMAILLSTLTTIAIILPFQFLDTGMLQRPVTALAQPLMWASSAVWRWRLLLRRFCLIGGIGAPPVPKAKRPAGCTFLRAYMAAVLSCSIANPW